MPGRLFALSQQVLEPRQLFSGLLATFGGALGGLLGGLSLLMGLFGRAGGCRAIRVNVRKHLPGGLGPRLKLLSSLVQHLLGGIDDSLRISDRLGLFAPSLDGELLELPPHELDTSLLLFGFGELGGDSFGALGFIVQELANRGDDLLPLRQFGPDIFGGRFGGLVDLLHNLDGRFGLTELILGLAQQFHRRLLPALDLAHDALSCSELFVQLSLELTALAAQLLLECVECFHRFGISLLDRLGL